MLKRPTKVWLSIGGIVCIAACMLMAVVWLRTSIARDREIAHRLNCLGSLTRIALGMRAYHNTYGHFPPAYVLGADGRPAHSWRVLILEFLEPELYAAYSFAEPWDGPNNRKLAERMPHMYSCATNPDAAAEYRTNYFVIVGDGTAFPGENTVSEVEIKQPRNTILIAESSNLVVRWMEPRDLEFDSMSFRINDPHRPSISSRKEGRSGACFVDGSKTWLSDANQDGATEKEVRELCLIRKDRAE